MLSSLCHYWPDPFLFLNILNCLLDAKAEQVSTIVVPSTVQDASTAAEPIADNSVHLYDGMSTTVIYFSPLVWIAMLIDLYALHYS